MIFCLFVLSACETQTVQREQLEQPTTGQSVVFGHADVIVDGKVKEWGLGWTGIKSCCLLLLPPTSNKTMTYQINDDGMFYFSLNPGEYQLLGFRFQKDAASLVGGIGGVFTVPEESQAIYIGNISIDMVKGAYITRVEDDIADSLNKYKAKYPQQSDQVMTSLLQLPDKIGKFDSMPHECNDHWGVDCSGDFRGVTPLSPDVKTHSLLPNKQPFPQVNNLKPKFSWKPAQKAGITYDLIIYAAATYGIGVGSEQTMKGRLVLYEENIASPSYQLVFVQKGRKLIRHKDVPAFSKAISL